LAVAKNIYWYLIQCVFRLGKNNVAMAIMEFVVDLLNRWVFPLFFYLILSFSGPYSSMRSMEISGTVSF